MIPLFGAVFCSPESESHMDLLQSFLSYEGFKSRVVSPKNWKDQTPGILLFPKPSPQLAKELLDWSIEPLLYGTFSDIDRDKYISQGVSLLWDKPAKSIVQLPITMASPNSITFCLYTSNSLFDKHMSLLLKSFGHTVYVEGRFEHLIKRIRTAPIDIVIINWDQPDLDLQKMIFDLKALQMEKQLLFLGLKNFDKDNLYRELAYGISEISPSLFSFREIFEIIAHSLPVKPPTTKPFPTTDAFKKLEFDFQEKKKPIRYRLIEGSHSFLKESEEEIRIRNLISIFSWLFNRSFEEQ